MSGRRVWQARHDHLIRNSHTHARSILHLREYTELLGIILFFVMSLFTDDDNVRRPAFKEKVFDRLAGLDTPSTFRYTSLCVDCYTARLCCSCKEGLKGIKSDTCEFAIVSQLLDGRQLENGVGLLD